MIKNKKNAYLIKSVDRAFFLLEQYRGDISELKLTELSKLLKIDKNYVLRLLATLEIHDFVECNKRTGGYRLGPTLLKLSQARFSSKRLLLEGRQFLEQTVGACHETLYLAVICDGRITNIDRIESNLPVRVAGSWKADTCAHWAE